ncbi:exported hypothetical protein [Burkholderiales bacterium]|nr:exported hypothetical protein [Burkholderiales bacterium]
MIAFGSTPERLIASFITVPASSLGSISAKPPPKVPTAERAAPSTTTSRLLIACLLAHGITKGKNWTPPNWHVPYTLFCPSRRPAPASVCRIALAFARPAPDLFRFLCALDLPRASCIAAATEFPDRTHGDFTLRDSRLACGAMASELRPHYRTPGMPRAASPREGYTAAGLERRALRGGQEASREGACHEPISDRRHRR